VEAAITAIRDQARGGRSAQALERNLRLGLTEAVDRWFSVATPSADNSLHFELGRAQARAARSLDELMGFYRIAGQTAWRRLTEVGAAQGIEPEFLYRLAETGFGYVEELSTQAAAGFAEEHSRRSGATHSRRSELLRMLLREPKPERDALEPAARAAGVELSSTLAFFVGAAERYEHFARWGREPFLLEPRAGEFVGVIFDPDEADRLPQLTAASERAGAQLALGPAVPMERATSSLARARSLFRLVRLGIVGGAPLVKADDNDLALLLGAEPQLALELAQRRLAPLDSVRGAKTRRNLALTLRAWLQNPGQRKTVAQLLDVHPQTVRYRMSRLRELFGDALDHSDGRFELELALRLLPFAALNDGAAEG
jgi:PucR C-terminal helix-turn-helix domain